MLDLEPATRVLTDLVPGVRDDQLSLPTPCAEAGLGDLLAHVDGSSIAFTAAATKTPSPGGGQRARPDASRLGTDWRTRIPGRLAALAAAWREPAAWTGRTSVGGQDFHGEVTEAVAEVLHRYGALSFWDYAAAGPYVSIRVLPPAGRPLAYKDAVFLSPHKFIGGLQTPGVLVVRRQLVRNRVPTVPGGGTVAFVSATAHRYLDDPVVRKEGGTPAIIGAIRAGLVFQLKEAVGTELIRAREERFWQRALAAWAAHPNIEILGRCDADRLSIISFGIQYRQRRLHHNFVVAVLNDLFGIQARGGCSCAGPYGHRLLGIDQT